MVFYSGKLTIGLLTLPALFCGFLFSSIIFVYERQFMTADTYKRWHQVWWPVTIRLAVIALAAAITTQPFEVMVFSGPIERRVHEESVRLEAMSRLRALEEAQAKTQGATGLTGTIEDKKFKDATTDNTKAREETNRLKGVEASARNALERAEGDVRSAAARRARARTQRQAIAASRSLAAAQTRAEDARLALRQAEGRVVTSVENEKDFVEQLKSAEQDIKGKQQLAEADVKRLQDWITQVRNAKPGQSVVENTDKQSPWRFQDADYDFFQRLGVINDLYYGRSPRWFEASPATRQRLSELFNLTDRDETDASAKQRSDADAHTFIWSYWAVIGVAAVIPLLLLALKGLLPIDLKFYYSTTEQQAAGNYEFMRFTFEDDRWTARHEHNGNHRPRRGRHP